MVRCLDGTFGIGGGRKGKGRKQEQIVWLKSFQSGDCELAVVVVMCYVFYLRRGLNSGKLLRGQV